MAKRKRKLFDASPPLGRQIVVSDADVAAAERLLSMLVASESRRGKPGDSALHSEVDNPSVLLAEAWRAFALRQRRLKVFGKGFTAEPPFAILLTLYVTENLEPIITISRLSELAMLSLTTVLRWLDQLTDGKWIERTEDKSDGRRVHIALTNKARLALQQVFSQPNDGRSV